MLQQIQDQQQLMNTSKEEISFQMSQNLKNSLDYFVEPIKPKIFQFSQNDQTQKTFSRLHQARNYRSKDISWKPILHSKKLNEDPKFILSLERKKARIISGIRDKQTEMNPKQAGVMHGSKVKYGYRSYNKYENEHKPKTWYPMEYKIIQQKQRKKKNPHMNFSLRYITEEKKKIAKNEAVGSEANLSARQKGSNIPYLNIFFTENMVKGKYSSSRPKTNTTRRSKPITQQKLRPQSVIFR